MYGISVVVVVFPEQVDITKKKGLVWHSRVKFKKKLPSTYLLKRCRRTVKRD